MPEADGAVAELTAKAQKLGVTAVSMAGEATTAIGETMGSFAATPSNRYWLGLALAMCWRE